MSELELDKLARDLVSIGALQFGSFKLKSGITSPFYIDLRLLVSHPLILKNVSSLMWNCIANNTQKDVLCGVPYTALPIATLMSVEHGVPMVMRRREIKAHGTGKMIEGVFKHGQTCLVVEDLITSGTSIIETVTSLEEVGLQVSNAVVLIDREQGGVQNLKERQKPITVHAVAKLSTLISTLQRDKLITPEQSKAVLDFIAANKAALPPPTTTSSSTSDENKAKSTTDNGKEASSTTASSTSAAASALASIPPPGTSSGLAVGLTYLQRSALAQNNVARRLLRLMDEKKSNLCVSIDVTTAEELLSIADSVGPYVVVVKTHIDIIDNFSAAMITSLEELAAKHDFFIMEDRKYVDIGNTTYYQYRGGLHRVASWAHLVTSVPASGADIVEALAKAASEQAQIGTTATSSSAASMSDQSTSSGVAGDAATTSSHRRRTSMFSPAVRGAVLVVEMSSRGTLASGEFTRQAVDIARKSPMFVAGIVSQQSYTQELPGVITMTPGVALSKGGDSLGQQYNDPASVVKGRGADIIIVGRGIVEAKDRIQAAKTFQELGYVLNGMHGIKDKYELLHSLYHEFANVHV